MAHGKDRKTHRDVDIAQRREQVAGLYKQGRTMREIGMAVGCSASAVCRDLEAVRESWREKSIDNLAEKEERELQSLDRAEDEAWAGWERSKADAEKTAEAAHGDGSKRTVRTLATRCGDPRFLDVVLKCVRQRCAIFGLDHPKASEYVPHKRPMAKEELFRQVHEKLAQLRLPGPPTAGDGPADTTE